KLHINILRRGAGGQPVATRAQVQAWVSLATKMYAQVGIRFDAVIKPPVNPPTVPVVVNVGAFNGYAGYTLTWSGWKYNMTSMEQALLGDANLRTRARDDIEVYYIGRFADGSIGESFRASAVPDSKYADSIIIGAFENDDQVLAHEIGHILTDDGGHPDGDI